MVKGRLDALSGSTLALGIICFLAGTPIVVNCLLNLSLLHSSGADGWNLVFYPSFFGAIYGLTTIVGVVLTLFRKGTWAGAGILIGFPIFVLLGILAIKAYGLFGFIVVLMPVCLPTWIVGIRAIVREKKARLSSPG